MQYAGPRSDAEHLSGSQVHPTRPHRFEHQLLAGPHGGSRAMPNHREVDRFRMRVTRHPLHLIPYCGIPFLVGGSAEDFGDAIPAIHKDSGFAEPKPGPGPSIAAHIGIRRQRHCLDPVTPVRVDDMDHLPSREALALNGAAKHELLVMDCFAVRTDQHISMADVAALAVLDPDLNACPA